MRKQRITVRLTENQMQVLSELCQALDTSYSMLVRSMVCDFLTKNEEVLERIIVNKLYSNADDSEIAEEAENLFGEN
jgi:hypothetical protein